MKLWIPILALAGAAALYLATTRQGAGYEPAAQARSAFAPAPAALSRAPAPEEELLCFEIEGMCCRGCTGKLHQSVSAVVGVREAAIDLDAATATVLAAESVDVASLVRALSIESYRATLRR